MNNNNYKISSRIVSDMQYARIIEILSEQLHISREEAMELFYSSPVFELIDQGVADLNCRSDKYLADEIMLWKNKVDNHDNYQSQKDADV